MSTHFVQIKTMKNMLSLPEGIDKNKALCLIVHACDISHASKPWHLHSRWTEGVLEEFFRQGDLEGPAWVPYSRLFAIATPCTLLTLKSASSTSSLSQQNGRLW
uniref:3',5'-cyclic phosphodiesterase pde-1 n=1 Tax=Ascaris suum TaxID=6253 RepID=F1LFS4_ASCSU